jgi:hypothetical protein
VSVLYVCTHKLLPTHTHTLHVRHSAERGRIVGVRGFPPRLRALCIEAGYATKASCDSLLKLFVDVASIHHKFHVVCSVISVVECLHLLAQVDSAFFG